MNYYIVAGYWTEPETNWAGRIIGQQAGDGAFPPDFIVTLGTINSPLVLLHETGHHMNLFHTQGGCSCGPGQNGASYATNYPGCIRTNQSYSVGAEDIADTLADAECLTADQIARANFNKALSACTADQQEKVKNTFFNLMSYHIGFYCSVEHYTYEVRLTELQADKWTYNANTIRANEVTGITCFVSPAGNDGYSGFDGTLPKAHVQAAVTNSAPGDIVMLRPGTYNERFTINQGVTLRATRVGWATIGR